MSTVRFRYLVADGSRCYVNIPARDLTDDDLELLDDELRALLEVSPLYEKVEVLDAPPSKERGKTAPQDKGDE